MLVGVEPAHHLACQMYLDTRDQREDGARVNLDLDLPSVGHLLARGVCIAWDVSRGRAGWVREASSARGDESGLDGLVVTVVVYYRSVP